MKNRIINIKGAEVISEIKQLSGPKAGKGRA